MLGAAQLLLRVFLALLRSALLVCAFLSSLRWCLTAASNARRSPERFCRGRWLNVLRVSSAGLLRVIQHRSPALRITARYCGCIHPLCCRCIQHTMLRALLLVKLAAAPAPVKLPDGFKAPEPKPLQIGDSEIPDLLSGAAALAVRLATGTLVLGWRPCFAEVGGIKLFGTELGADEYALTFGPLRFRDDSSVLPAARPSKPIIVYEYESSPFCRKVREMCCLLDLEVDAGPCRARGGAGEELFWEGNNGTIHGPAPASVRSVAPMA